MSNKLYLIVVFIYLPLSYDPLEPAKRSVYTLGQCLYNITSAVITITNYLMIQGNN